MFRVPCVIHIIAKYHFVNNKYSASDYFKYFQLNFSQEKYLGMIITIMLLKCLVNALAPQLMVW